MKNEFKINGILNKFSLRTIIVVPVILILLLASFFSYLLIDSFVERHSEKIVLSNQLRIKNHIFDHLDNYFKIPELINKINVDLAMAGQLDVSNADSLGKILLKEVHSDNSIDYAYYANEDGGIVSSGLYRGANRISYTDGLKSGDFKVYQLDEDGEELQYIKSIKNFDPRDTAWYIEATKENQIYWTEIYLGAQEDVLGMSTSYPLFSEDGIKLGVFGTDILLDQLSDFLKTIKTTENGVLCLVDENGMIVATSVSENPFVELDGSQYRLQAVNSKNDVIRLAYSSIESEGNFPLLADYEVKENIMGKNYHYSFSNYSYNNNINWTLMIAIPREDLINDIEVLFFRFTIIFITIALLVIISYVVISRWIVKPIISLNSKVNKMGHDNWGIQIPTDRNDELGQLTRTFNKMSLKLKDYLEKLDEKQGELEKINASLEKTVFERTKELERLSVTDSLTDIYNKRYLLDKLSKNIKLAKRYDDIFSIIIFDVDYFKEVNDNYGHLEGDRILIELCEYLSSRIRETDILGRYGGEEFIIIMPKTTLMDAYLASERYREDLSKMYLGSIGIQITISGGLAEYVDGDTIISIINRADKKLYIAKDKGRNMIVK